VVVVAAFRIGRAADVLGVSAHRSPTRLPCIVIAVVKDTVMARVDIQAGPFREVAVMGRMAVDDMDLHVGSVAVAVIAPTRRGRARSVAVPTIRGASHDT
jgi:molybdopterin-binding protein